MDKKNTTLIIILAIVVLLVVRSWINRNKPQKPLFGINIISPF